MPYGSTSNPTSTSWAYKKARHSTASGVVLLKLLILLLSSTPHKFVLRSAWLLVPLQPLCYQILWK